MPITRMGGAGRGKRDRHPGSVADDVPRRVARSILYGRRTCLAMPSSSDGNPSKAPFSAYVAISHRFCEAVRTRARGASDESGQILSVVAVSMTLLLICVGLVVDVGHAMLVQRQLQAGVDAAALAGVQHLPDKFAAESVAMQYSATPGSKNAVNTVNSTLRQAVHHGVPG